MGTVTVQHVGKSGARLTGTEYEDAGQHDVAVTLTAADLGAQSILDRTGVLNDIVNVNTEQTLYEVTIPAGRLGTDEGLAFWLGGDLLNNSGANRTLTVKVYYGTTLMFSDVTGNIGANAALRPWFMQGRFAALHSTSSQMFLMYFEIGATTANSAGWGDVAGNSLFSRLIGGTASEDSTAAKSFKITVQWSLNDANLSIKRRWAQMAG